MIDIRGRHKVKAFPTKVETVVLSPKDNFLKLERIQCKSTNWCGKFIFQSIKESAERKKAYKLWHHLLSSLGKEPKRGWQLWSRQTTKAETSFWCKRLQQKKQHRNSVRCWWNVKSYQWGNLRDQALNNWCLVNAKAVLLIKKKRWAKKCTISHNFDQKLMDLVGKNQLTQIFKSGLTRLTQQQQSYSISDSQYADQSLKQDKSKQSLYMFIVICQKA